MKIRSESGFTYVEVLIAIVILTVGILAMLAAISAAVLQSRGQDQQLTARHIAASTLESIMSVKETDPDRMGWKAVGNIGSNPDPDDGNTPKGIFIVGRHDVLANAGPDEVIGTEDDAGDVLTGFQREITIIDQCDLDRPSANCPTPGDSPVKIRLIEVRVHFFVGLTERTELVRTVLTDYSVTD